jgi:hypothetical protein
LARRSAVAFSEGGKPGPRVTNSSACCPGFPLARE